MTDAMEYYFDNFAAAATSNKTVLETLVSSNAKLTATNAKNRPQDHGTNLEE